MNEGRLTFNKLIRDKVAERMQERGVEYSARTLSEEEYKAELLKKVGEEALGVQNAQTREELVSEMADVLEVLSALRKLEGITEEEIETALTRNMEKKGGFDTRTFLEWTADDGYKTNEQK